MYQDLVDMLIVDMKSEGQSECGLERSRGAECGLERHPLGYCIYIAGYCAIAISRLFIIRHSRTMVVS